MNKRGSLNDLLIANKEKANRARELVIANEEKEKRAAELVIANVEKEKRAAELVIANIEKGKRANELVIADKEKQKRVAELAIADEEKAKRVAELVIDNEDKAKRVAELVIANGEKAKRAAELIIANVDKAKREAELVIANVEKTKRASELLFAKKELIQAEEKAKLVDELMHANKDLIHQIGIREKTEDKLEQLIHDLKELNATKDKLFSIIAHDLRSPFTSILGFSELLIENIRTYGPENSEEFITHINSTAEHTLTLLDNLLSWARTQTGQIDFKPENLQPRPTVEEIVGLLNSSATIKNITLNNCIPDDIITYADPNMLKTILRNLVQNAIKFTNTGGTVDILATPQQNHTLFTVTDNGVGMSEETRNNIFKIDTTVIKNGTDHERGSGLGLILCKEFVEKHGGKIWAESGYGKGSKFEFTIPSSIK
jgi:signal transduction histidine kinase